MTDPPAKVLYGGQEFENPNNVPFERFWSRAAQALAPRVEVWDLEFICNLALGICDFRHKAPRQSHLSRTWPIGAGFRNWNKGVCRCF